MTFCLNPDCQNPENPDDAKRCLSCGSKLLLKARYRPIQPIGKSGSTFLATDERKRSKPQCAIVRFVPQGKSRPASTSLPALRAGAGSEPIKAEETDLFDRTAAHLAELGKHPQFPELLAFGEQDGQQYLVCEWVEGLSLAELLVKEGAFTEVEIRQLLNDVLSALQLLHEKQLVHGDIKPQNIIRRTGSASDDQPQPIFVLVGFSGATGTGSALSPHTAPERASGKTTAASDLYSLGVTCIQMLTQIHPLELLDSRQDIWVWQDYLRHNISSSLRRTLSKLLLRQPVHRYQSATEVLEDLQPGSKPGTARHAPQLPVSPPMPVEPLEWKCAHILRGHTLTVRSISLSPDEQTLASGSHDGTIKLWDLPTGNLLRTIEADSYDVHALAFTRDGRSLISGSNNQTVKLWNPQTGKCVRTLARLDHSITALALSPDGQMLATGEYSGTVKLWELSSGALLDTLGSAENENPCHGLDSLAFSPDGEFLVTSGEVWHVSSGKRVYNYMAEAVWGHSVAVSPDGQTFAVTGDTDRTARLVNLRTGEVIHSFKGHIKSLRAVTFRPDGLVLATSGKDGRIKLWNTSTGKAIQTIPGHSSVVFGLRFTRDGKTLISCAQDKKIKVWQCDIP
jgi:WD40 repeat protein